jgi:DNA-binding beta-propeller fold protein YncE
VAQLLAGKFVSNKQLPSTQRLSAGSKVVEPLAAMENTFSTLFLRYSSWSRYSSLSTAQLFATGTEVPTGVAVTPDNDRAYITLAGTDQYAVFDDTIAVMGVTPSQLSSSSFSLTSGAAPRGVSVPPLMPLPTTGVRVYIAQSGLGVPSP